MSRSPYTTRQISHDEAGDVARRLINGSFRCDGELLDYGLGPKFSIPTRPDQDDDCLITAYVDQQREAALVAAHEIEELRAAIRLKETPVADPLFYVSPGQLRLIEDSDDVGGTYLPVRNTAMGNFVMPVYGDANFADSLSSPEVLARNSVTERLRVGGETWVETLRRQERHGLGSPQDTWRDAAFALAAALDDQTKRAVRLEGDLFRMSLDELVALRERARNCTVVLVGDEVTS